MTICIAAIAESRYVITISDKTHIMDDGWHTFRYNETKTVKITDRCVFLSAGDAIQSNLIYNKVHKILEQGRNTTSIQDVVDLIRDAYNNARNKKLEQDVFAPKNMTLARFNQDSNTLDATTRTDLILDMEHFEYGVSILIAGVDETGPHIFRVDDSTNMESYDDIGHCPIGSGNIHALSAFDTNSYHSKMNLERVIAIICDAKHKSEKAEGVGKEADLHMISDKGIHKFDDNRMQQLYDIFEEKVKHDEGYARKIVRIVYDGRKNLVCNYLDVNGKLYKS